MIHRSLHEYTDDCTFLNPMHVVKVTSNFLELGLWHPSEATGTRQRRCSYLRKYHHFSGLILTVMSLSRTFYAARAFSLSNRIRSSAVHVPQRVKCPWSTPAKFQGFQGRQHWSQSRSLRYLGTQEANDPHVISVKAAIHAAIEELDEAGVDEAEDSVYNILSKVLDLSWETGYRELRELHNLSWEHSTNNQLAKQTLTDEQLNLLQRLLERRKAHEPIQYLVGKWDFLDYTFAVCPPLLCPRPETEELVLYAFENLKAQNPSPSPVSLRILDVGCGTGCIGISLADRLPNATVIALDVEPKAVEIAMQNANTILGKHDSDRYEARLLSAEDFEVEKDEDRFDLVVSNPPYIPASDMNSLEKVVSLYESHTALCGGTDGMDVIRTIVKKLPQWCHSGADCWMEVDPSHPTLLRKWLTNNSNDTNDTSVGVSFVESRVDFQGLDRFVHLRVM